MHLPGCHIAEVSRNTFYSNEICDKLKTTQTSKNIPFHLVLVLFKRKLYPEYILAQQKILVRLTCICFQYFFFSKKIPIVVRDICMSVCPSVRPSVRPCVSMSFCGNLISNEPIDSKTGLNVGYGVVHVRKA